MEKQVLLQVRDYRVSFHTRTSLVYAVNGINFDVFKGETLGIVGESGCGKTVSCMSMLKLIPMPPGRIDTGKVLFDGTDLVPLGEKAIAKYRGKEISVVFQDPMTAFNPVLTIGDQLTEGYLKHFQVSRKQAQKRAEEMLGLVGIPAPESRLKNYSYEFSGGMCQRAMIAMALMCEPKLIIADEPTTALDVTIQAQIVDLMKEIRNKFETSIIWISHDLGVQAALADRLNVMYAGFIVEQGDAVSVYGNPLHPYTLGLLESLPSIEDTSDKKHLFSIPGMPPYMDKLPLGCPFAPRCTHAMKECQISMPEIREVETGHFVACHLFDQKGSVQKWNC
jgi:oligopeptide transport system ATP-binding protein